MRQVVILAGGLGTRLRPITEKIPKPLVEVAGQPFLYWQIKDLQRQGYKKVLLLVSYLGEMIQETFGDGSDLGIEIDYSFEKEPLGTGGALSQAREKLDSEFALLNGDSFLRCPLNEMADVFERNNWKALVASFPHPEKTDVIGNLKAQDGRVLDYQKDGGAENGYSHVDAGVYVLSKEIVPIFKGERFQLEEIWPELLESRQMGLFPVHERFYDIGTPERLGVFERKISDYF